MAEIPELSIKMTNKAPSTKVSAEGSAAPGVSLVRLAPNTTVAAVKLTPSVPIQILRVEDKGSSLQQLTDAHGRPMGVATPVPVLAQVGHANSTQAAGTVNSNTGGTRKKTGSSFQITSVTDGSRLSNDGGDDSADDLDESHTDDLSSELGVDISKTDYDYSSEDAFSSIKDDPAAALHASQYAQHSQQQQQPPLLSANLGAAPQISLFTTTAHADGSGPAATTVDSTAANVSVTVVESPATVPMSVVQNPEIQWHNRFRVVKIESSEPFRRGRWLCMDFLDPPPPSLPHGEVGDKDSSTVSGVSGGGNGSGNSSGPNSLNHGDSLVIEHGSGIGAQTIITSTWSIEPNAQFGSAGGVPVPIISAGIGSNEKGPIISNVGVNCDHYPVSIILQTQQQGNLDFTNTALHMQGRNPQFIQQGYNLVSSNLGSYEFTGASNVPASTTTTVSQDYQQSQAAPVQAASTSDYSHPLPNTTLPDLHLNSGSQVIGHHQVSSSITTAPNEFLAGGGGVSPAVIAAQSQPPLVYPTPAVSNADYPQQPQSVTVQPSSTQVTTAIQSQPTQQPTSQCYIQQVVPVVASSTVVPASDPIQQTDVGTTSSMVGVATNISSSSVQQVTNAVSSSNVSGGGAVASPSQETADGCQQVVQQSGEEGEAESLKALAAFLGEGSKIPGASVSPIHDCTVFSSGKYSSSGASTVAIDNKIEQAMDLVKSHLMFAVREEVDVLKEKITELMERINQLEFENTILKAAASPETLAKLANSQTPNPPSN